MILHHMQLNLFLSLLPTVSVVPHHHNLANICTTGVMLEVHLKVPEAGVVCHGDDGEVRVLAVTPLTLLCPISTKEAYRNIDGADTDNEAQDTK